METERLVIEDREFQINVYNESRNNSRASIGKKGINIRVPRFLNREERFGEILKLKKWAIETIRKNPDIFDQKQTKFREYENGEVFNVGVDSYQVFIKFSDKQGSSVRINNNKIFLDISSNLSDDEKKESISALISRVIAKNKFSYIKTKVDELNKKYFNFAYKKIFLKHNKSNWGSCSCKGNINLSTRLLFATEDILEYVIVHELAHLKEHNHSENFWNLVKSAVPDHKERSKWLRKNGKEFIF